MKTWMGLGLLLSMGLSLGGCGVKSTGSGLSDVAATAVRPNFPQTGQTFFISTGCSPHSLNIHLALNAANIVVLEEQATPETKKLTYDYDTATVSIAQTHWDVSGLHTDTTSAVRGQASFQSGLAALKADVQTLETGNACFPGQSELAPVVSYLQGIANAAIKA